MLKLESKPTMTTKIALGAAVLFVPAVMVSANVLGNLWTRDLCGRVIVTEYTAGSAPSKCQDLWNGGQL